MMEITKQEEKIIEIIREEKDIIKYGKIEIEVLVNNKRLTNVQTIRVKRSTQIPFVA